MYNSDCIPIKDIKPGLKNINVIFIIMDFGSSTVTKENREVRNFKVGDPTACINVSIWDEPGKLIVPGDIIKMTKGYASIWRHCLTLYSGKNGEIFKMGEFCMTFNETINMSEPKRPEQQQPQQQQVGSILMNPQPLPIAGLTPIIAPNNGGNNNNNNGSSMVNRGTISSVPGGSLQPVSVAAQTQKLTQAQQQGRTGPSIVEQQKAPIVNASTQAIAQQTPASQSQPHQSTKTNRGGRSQSRNSLKADRR